MEKRNSAALAVPANDPPVSGNEKYTADAFNAGDVESPPFDELYDIRYLQIQRGLKSRHAQMIAIGGTIGTGLFVGSGATLAVGGPAFILAAYILLTIMVVFVVTCMVEVAAFLPVHGGTMSYYGHRYVSNSLGFAMGWLYFYSLGILVPYEITAAGLVIDYWSPPINIGVWMTVMIVVIVGLNILPVHFYGETEFWFASLKIFLMLGLLILSFILFWGGGPSQNGILGFHYWKDPGAANTYLLSGQTGLFLGFIETVILAAFPFVFAPELLVVTAGEMESPRRNLPKAAQRYFTRLIVFYVLGVLAIGVICPSDDPNLTEGGTSAKASPFVIGIKNAGIKGLDSVVNAIIITSAWSSGNSFLYVSSRSLYSLAIAGHAPRIFKTCSKNGVPYFAVAASSVFTLLAYLNLGNSGSTVFTWFINLSNTAGFLSWISCCIVYLRFRKAVAAQGMQSELPWTSRLQPWGAWIALVFFAILTLANGFSVFFPSEWGTSAFLTAYIGIPIYLVIYFGHRIYARKEPWAWRSEKVDLTSGLEEVMNAEKPAPVYDKWWEKVKAAIE